MFSSCHCSCLSGFCLVTELSHFIHNLMEKLLTYIANKQTNKCDFWFTIRAGLLETWRSSCWVCFQEVQPSHFIGYTHEGQRSTCGMSGKNEKHAGSHRPLTWSQSNLTGCTIPLWIFFSLYLDWFKPCTHTEGIVENSSATVWVQRRWVIFAVHALSRTALTRLRRPSQLAFVKAVWAPCVNEVITQSHSRP